jgi:hypothetical protein
MEDIMRTSVIALIIAVTGLASPAAAQTMRSGSVTMVRTGWNVDSFAIVTAEPISNPASCPTPDGYISEKSFPGYSTYYAAALTAIATRRHVVISIHDSECWAGRPKIIGINLTSD